MVKLIKGKSIKKELVCTECDRKYKGKEVLKFAFRNRQKDHLLGKSIAGNTRKRFFVVRQVLSSLGILISALITRELLKRFEYPENYQILFAAAAVALFMAALGFIALRAQTIANRC